MNWSAALVALVPPAVFTVTSTVALPAGAVALILVELLNVKAAETAPKKTPVAPVKFVPVMLTGVPPTVGPAVGLIAVTVGAGV